jgi:hypothetical protein
MTIKLLDFVSKCRTIELSGKEKTETISQCRKKKIPNALVHFHIVKKKKPRRLTSLFSSEPVIISNLVGTSAITQIM